MLEQLTFDQNGVKTVCEMGTFHPEMRMTIRVKRFTPGETYTVFSETCETAFLILYGRASVAWNGETREMQRATPFEKSPYCLHVPRGVRVTLEAAEDTEILYEQTDNEREFEPVFYTPDMILYQEFGKGQWAARGTAWCRPSLTTTTRPIPTWCSARCSTSPANGPVTRRTTTRSPRSITINLINRRGSARASTATTSGKACMVRPVT